jgi:gas vesicle protein
MPDRNAFGGFAVGILIGGLTAGVAALLFAPQSGAETRTMIKDKSIELRDKAQERTEEALARVEAITTETRARIEEVAVQLGRQNKNAAAPVQSMAAEKLDNQSTV